MSIDLESTCLTLAEAIRRDFQARMQEGGCEHVDPGAAALGGLCNPCGDATVALTLKAALCGLCKHLTIDNTHGFDQNDADMIDDKLVHYGRCTYCNLCNPGCQLTNNIPPTTP